MNEEYFIEIVLTPHYHDNNESPYFWMLGVIGENGERYNSGSGWAVSPNEAYNQAYLHYNKKYNKK